MALETLMAAERDAIGRELGRVFDARVVEVLVGVLERVVGVWQDGVVREELREMRQVLAELAQAQARTEHRMDELVQAQARTEHRMDELAQAQVRTEHRLEALTARVDTLAERMDELAKAQVLTEHRLEVLTGRVDMLVEAQRRTEETLQILARKQNETSEQLGGLAMTVGYTLENEAYKALPRLLEADYRVVVTGRLKRGYVTDGKGRRLEVNITGEAIQQGRPVMVIGEGKSQLSKNDVDRFLRKKVNPLAEVYGEVFLVVVTHMISEPDVEEYVKEKGIALYYSYDF